MILGGKVYLSELDPDNMETIRSWINDPEVHEWMLGGHVPITKEQEAAFYAASDSATDAHRFEIHRESDGELLGICGLEAVDLRHGHGEAGIFIGDTSEQDKGFGGDALRTLLGFAFDTLRLHTVQIRYIDGNERAAHLYPKLGFKPAGRLRGYHFVRGEHRDSVLLDMTLDEYRSSE